ncbi:MAG: hypothetical protein ABJE66_25060 [Deltaproteobacteria bacterium]
MTALLVFGTFAFLATFTAGSMLTLQLQHYAIYPHVGRDGFAGYIAANNRAAVVPVIVPAILLLVTSAVLVIVRPAFMTRVEASMAFALNLVQLASTFRWQRRLQAEMAVTGYDNAKTAMLVATNWIRTFALLAQALLASVVLIRALHATYAFGAP